MSKRKIEAALRRKGLAYEVLEYGWQATPGEMVAGWAIQLTPYSEDKISVLDPDFNDFEPDCANSQEVLEWIDGLPDVTGI